MGAIGSNTADYSSACDTLAGDLGVRWDAVVGSRAVAADTCKTRPHAVEAIAGEACHRRIQIRVQMFGALATLCAERSVTFELPANTTLAGMLAALSRHYDPSFLTHIVDAAGAKRRHCRLFVDGYAVEDLQTQLRAAADPTEIDIILLIAPEGG
jgi:hypothetical protein